MKRETIKAAAINCVTQDYWGAGPIPHPVRGPIEERFFELGAEWALEQVREWADREYDKRGDKMQDEFIVGERIALAECCEFCKVEGDK
jgi:hypothetical protein